ncbi:unnamed protein product [Cylindrotheca closterium]|uniref:DUF6824 domain-containing protein n=1 Tax=Cylindrotheca closterium TaxID=2856 RepID=A0AAD2CNP5_9STRA|nr:unnamed protein product [Cylindrotheca closterium]
MGKNRGLRSLRIRDYSCCEKESSSGFYIDQKHAPTLSFQSRMPASCEFGYLPHSNSNIFRLVTNIKPDDVLSGRGGATNSHSGNRVFRALVKRYQSKYLQAKKRDKPGVASTIVEAIRRKGGRFLRRQGSRFDPGVVAWVDIGDVRAREKTCQALREGAPEIRKKKNESLVDGGEMKKVVIGRKMRGTGVDYSHPQTGVQKSESFVMSRESERKCNSVSADAASAHFVNDEGKDVPIMIRPSFELTKNAFAEAISVDQLEPHDRILYLRDFFPPDAAIPRRVETTSSCQYNLGHCDSSLCPSFFVEV